MAREIRNVAASVHARLLRVAHERGEELQRLLVHFALERFLYRLGRSSHSAHYVLKGAMLFQAWDGSLPRATRDLDLLGMGESSENAIRYTFSEIWRIEDVEDGLKLDRTSLTSRVILDRSVGAPRRIRCRVHLGTASIPLQIDVGFGDAVHPAAELIEYPTLLDFPHPRVWAYPKEAVVAEKIHAIVDLGLRNSRLKDYFDLSHLAGTQSFAGRTLQEAIQATFDRRDTPIPQSHIDALGPGFAKDPMKQTQWAAFQRRAGLAPESLEHVVQKVRELVEPIVVAIGSGADFSKTWPPGGPWER